MSLASCCYGVIGWLVAGQSPQLQTHKAKVHLIWVSNKTVRDFIVIIIVVVIVIVIVIVIIIVIIIIIMPTNKGGPVVYKPTM